MNRTPKILIVSDIASFSTSDVFYGAIDGFEQLNAKVDNIYMPELFDYKVLVNDIIAFNARLLKENKILMKNKGFTDWHIWSIAISKMMDENFDYILFIGGTCVPPWVFKRLKQINKRIVIWATDDPHSTGMLERYLEYIDIYLTNERTLHDVFGNKTHYVPMAAPIINDIPPDVLDGSHDEYLAQDILFCGSVYPNRVPLLEKVCHYAKEKNLKLKIMGHLNLVPKDSIIHEFGKHETIDSRVTRWYYTRSKVVINIDRDPSWSPTGIENKWRIKPELEPESTNPRLYEVPIFGSLQVYINPRKEAKEILPNLIYANEDNINEILTMALNYYKPEYERFLDKIKTENFNRIVQDHTYLNRVIQIKRIIEKDWNDYNRQQETIKYFN